MLILGLGQQIRSLGLEHLIVLEIKELKMCTYTHVYTLHHTHNDRGMSKRYRNQLRELPIVKAGTIWAKKLSSADYNPKYEIISKRSCSYEGMIKYINERGEETNLLCSRISNNLCRCFAVKEREPNPLLLKHELSMVPSSKEYGMESGGRLFYCGWAWRTLYQTGDQGHINSNKACW